MIERTHFESGDAGDGGDEAAPLGQWLPFCLLRIAPRPFRELDRLTVPEAARLADQVDETGRRLATARVRLCNALHVQIGRQGAGKNILVELKRDTYNRRPRARRTAARAAGLLPETISRELDALLSAQEEGARLWQQGEALFAQEAARVRHALRALVALPELDHGLLLSSLTLRDELRALRARPADQPLTRRELRAEQGAIQYLARLYTKTSPSSTFTLVGWGRLALAAQPAPERGAPRSRVALRGGLLMGLRAALAATPELRAGLPLRLNPTVCRLADRLVWLGRRGGQETFQQTAADPLHDHLRVWMAGEARDLDLRGLVDFIRRETDATAEAAAQHADRLIACAFVEPDLTLPWQDPAWENELLRKVLPETGRVPGPAIAGRLADGLRRLGRSRDSFERAAGDERLRALRAAHEEEGALATLVQSLGGQGPASPPAATRPEDALLETCVFEAPRTIDSRRLRPLWDDLLRLHQVLARLPVHKGDHAAALACYRARFGEGASVPVMALYEEMARARVTQAVSAALPEGPATTIEDRLVALLRDLLSRGDDPVRIRAADLDGLPGTDVPASALEPFGALVQLLPPRDDAPFEGVLNLLAPGRGKVWSRFLSLLPLELLEAIVARNSQAPGGALLAEIVDETACLNASQHPRSCPTRSSCPGPSGGCRLPAGCRWETSRCGTTRTAGGSSCSLRGGGAPWCPTTSG